MEPRNETLESEVRNRFFVAMAEHVRGKDDIRPLTAVLLGFGGMEAIGRYIVTAFGKSLVISEFGEEKLAFKVMSDYYQSRR